MDVRIYISILILFLSASTNSNSLSYFFPYVYIDDFPGTNETFSTNVVLQNSYADSSGKDGIKVFRMKDASILGTMTLNNGRHGVHIAGSENILLEGNTFVSGGAKESYNGCGVMITDREELWSNGIIAKYTRIHNFYRAGFCLGKSRWLGLIDSTITNTRREKAQCYEMDGAEDVTIIRGSCWTLNAEDKNDTSGDEGEATGITNAIVAEKSPEPSGCLMNEIQKGGVCCPGICGTCGGDGCSARAPYKACCVNEIRKAGNLCANGPAPCNL